MSGTLLERRRATCTFAGELRKLLLQFIDSFQEKSKFTNFRDAKNMATDVRNILLKIIKEQGKMSDIEAQQYIKKMETQKRYSADVWS